MYKKQDALVPVFGALCFFLSAVEMLIPKPLPFLRLGLANIPLLLGTEVFSFPAFLLLAVIKIIGQGVISGTLFSYLILFSIIGTFSAAVLMYGLSKLPRKIISLSGISITAAFVSNSLQLMLGEYLIFGKGVWYIAPAVLLTGIFTGLIVGVICTTFVEESAWFAAITHEDYELVIPAAQHTQQTDHPIFRILSACVLFLFLFFLPFLTVKVVIFITAILLCYAEKQTIHWKPLLISTAGIIICHSFIPSGKVLAAIPGITFTAGAFLTGIEKSLLLGTMIYLSRWMLQVRFHFESVLGKYLTQSLYVFKLLNNLHRRVSPKQFISDIDEILLSLPYAESVEDDTE